jgi:hypothetical protein
MNDLFNNFGFAQPTEWPLMSYAGNNRTWMPRLDVSETEKEIIVTAELPGLEEKDVTSPSPATSSSSAARRRKRRKTRTGLPPHRAELGQLPTVAAAVLGGRSQRHQGDLQPGRAHCDLDQDAQGTRADPQDPGEVHLTGSNGAPGPPRVDSRATALTCSSGGGAGRGYP